MALPPLPRDYVSNRNISTIRPDDIIRTIENIFVYLQRIRDGSANDILTVLEQNPALILDIIFTVFATSSTIEFLEIANTIQAEILSDSVLYSKIQKVSSAKLLGNYTGTLDNIKEITLGNGLVFNGDVLDVNQFLGNSRVVQATQSVSLQDTYSLVVSRYFTVLGIFTLLGDASLEIL